MERHFIPVLLLYVLSSGLLVARLEEMGYCESTVVNFGIELDLTGCYWRDWPLRSCCPETHF